ncbi:MAG: carboxypeptidase-like regulatory domain-containing protein, partial [Nanoarchaeota archaeon]
NKAPPMREKEIKYPTQIPRPSGGAEVIVPEAVTQSKKVESSKKQNTGSAVPIKQRIVDASGKSVFLADVEIFNAESGESASKTRTNGTGKWVASLPLGNYRVVVRKRDSLSKDTKEIVQSVQIDGSLNQIELPVMIIK